MIKPIRKQYERLSIIQKLNESLTKNRVCYTETDLSCEDYDFDILTNIVLVLPSVLYGVPNFLINLRIKVYKPYHCFTLLCLYRNQAFLL